MNRKELFLLSIGVFLTVVAWLTADIYNAATQQKIKSKTAIPTLQRYQINQGILNNLKQKTN